MSCILLRRMTAIHWRILFAILYQVGFLRLGFTHLSLLGVGGEVVCKEG